MKDAFANSDLGPQGQVGDLEVLASMQGTHFIFTGARKNWGKSMHPFQLGGRNNKKKKNHFPTWH